MLYRGRMPVFYYLSEQEAADVYLYLTTYPPSESAHVGTVIALSQQGPKAGGGMPPPQQAGSNSYGPHALLPGRQQATEDTGLQTVILLSAVGSFVVLLLVGGLGFTMREFQRLTGSGQSRSLAVKTSLKGRTEDAKPTLQHVS